MTQTGDEYDALLKRTIGTKITHAEYTDPNTGEWGDHGLVTITLDTGLCLELYSTGYDASDIHVSEKDA